VFDSLYDSYRGCIAYVRVFSGTIKAHDMMMLMSTGQKAEVKEVGVVHAEDDQDRVARPRRRWLHRLQHQEPGRRQDRRHHHARGPSRAEMLPGYKEVRPLVFCGLYPLESDDYEKLKAALGRLQLNDAAFVYASESSLALGFGFRCGFSACCTWKSSRSASAGSTTWRSSRLIRASSTTW